MRYIGNKRNLLEAIISIIQTLPDIKSITDVFAGTGTVSDRLSIDYNVVSNDNMYYSWIIQYCSLKLQVLDFSKMPESLNTVDKVTNHFNTLGPDLVKGFIYNNYCPSGNNEYNRTYFTNENGLIIDTIRTLGHNWFADNLISSNEYIWIIGNLLKCADKRANTTSIYGAYLKQFSSISMKRIHFQEHFKVRTSDPHTCFCLDGRNVLDFQKSDLLYMDPPYNNRQYCDNYHLLETIARYDSPLIHGKVGNRNNTIVKSNFCKKKTVACEFEYYFTNCKSKYILLSYSSDGLLKKTELLELIERCEYTVLSFQEIPYRKFKSQNKGGSVVVDEYLILFERKK